MQGRVRCSTLSGGAQGDSHLVNLRGCLEIPRGHCNGGEPTFTVVGTCMTGVFGGLEACASFLLPGCHFLQCLTQIPIVSYSYGLDPMAFCHFCLGPSCGVWLCSAC